MSIISDLITLKFLTSIKPGNTILVLAFIYLGFLCWGTPWAFIIYIIICIIVLAMFTIVPWLASKQEPKTWDNDPEIKALKQFRELEEREQLGRNNKNPYD